jgi:hypothetical protein
MVPLHPWRRSYRPKKYVVAGTYAYSPRFIKKRGPPKMRHLTHNSLFPATRRLIDARRTAQIHRYWKSKQKHTHFAPSFVQTIPHDTDEFLNSEDMALGVWSFDRWAGDEYELRMDEMDVFTTCLNHSTFAEQGGILFFYGTPDLDMPRASALRLLDWTLPLSLETVSPFIFSDAYS